MAYLYYILLGVKHRHRHYNSSSPIITYHSIMQYRIDWNNVADSAGAHSGSYGCSHCCCDLKGCKSIWDGKVQAKGLRVGISTWTLAIFPGSTAGSGARMIRERGYHLPGEYLVPSKFSCALYTTSKEMWDVKKITIAQVCDWNILHVIFLLNPLAGTSWWNSGHNLSWSVFQG